MADGIIVIVFTRILGSLASQSFKKFARLRGLTDELQLLENSVSTVGDILIDAEEKHHTNPAVKVWLQQLKHVFRDAEVLVDEISTAKLHHQRSNGVSKFVSSSSPFFLLKFVVPRETTQQIDQTASGSQLLLQLVEQPIIEVRARIVGRMRELTNSFVPSEYITGRDEAESEIVKLLVMCNCLHEFHELPGLQVILTHSCKQREN